MIIYHFISIADPLNRHQQPKNPPNQNKILLQMPRIPDLPCVCASL